MKLKELLEDLKAKDSYKDFIKENPDSYFCSAMFILGDADKIDLNFFLPKEAKLSSFSMPFASITNHQEETKEQKEIISLDLKIDIRDLKKYIEEKTGKDYKKIIAVLHEEIWNVTCLNGMDMAQIKINAYTGEIQDKKSGMLSDIIQIKKNPSKPEQ
jgi:hypothetical protein